MKNLLLTMFATLIIPSVASAQEPCDGQTGAGKGLCIAYCEAIDCDEDPMANPTACERVKENWQNKTGGTDLPCEASCPCDWDAAIDAINDPGADGPGCAIVAFDNSFQSFSDCDATDFAVISSANNECSYRVDQGATTTESLSAAEFTACTTELFTEGDLCASGTTVCASDADCPTTCNVTYGLCDFSNP